MRITNEDIRGTITPLRLIFWGGLLFILDFNISQTVNGVGWRFDFLNDFVGMLLITRGAFQLAQIRVHDRYTKAMSFAKVIAVLACIDAFHAHFIYEVPALFSFLSSAVAFLFLAATVAFLVAMRWLCTEAGLVDAARSWKTTTLLYVVIYAIPIGLFHIVGTLAQLLTQEHFHIDLGMAGLLLLPLFLLPVIHLFISTSRMKAAAEEYG